MSVFDLYGKYYNLLYQDKDYAEEAQYIKNILFNHGVSTGRVLEFGSGTGKHGGLLAKEGFIVHGIELSPEMISQAEKVSGFSCQQGDVRYMRLEEKFEAVVSLFHVASYQVGNNDIEDMFSNACYHLESGGLFIFDFWYSPAVYNLRPSVRVKRMQDETVTITRIAEPENFWNENTVEVKYTIFAQDLVGGGFEVFEERHLMRHFSLPEIDLLAEKMGFQRVGVEEFLTGNRPSSKTWGVCVVLSKR